MSSHHSIKFFITHYGQEASAIRRREIKAQKRALEREENALKWAAYRQQRAEAKVKLLWYYWSTEALVIGWMLTTLAIVVYGLRNI